MLDRSGDITPPTILQTAPLGAFSKRERADLVHHAHLLGIDFHPLDQRPDNRTSRRPIRVVEPLLHPLGGLLKLADPQPQFALLGLPLRLGFDPRLELGQSLPRPANPR